MIRRIFVGDNERVLLIRKKRLADILGPGRILDFHSRPLCRSRALQRQGHSPSPSEWTNAIVNLRPDLAGRYFTLVETGDAQVAVVYLDGKVAQRHRPRERACCSGAERSR